MVTLGENLLKKENLKFSLIEVTRRCNLSCKHCMRGEPQNITIKKEYIDKYFDEINSIMNINLTGGEPLLALDECEYIVDKIINSNFSTLGFSIITNGTVLDERVSDMFNRMYDYLYSKWGKSDDDSPHVSMIISNSEFHNNNPQKAYDFYKPLLNKNISLEFRRDDSTTKHMKGLVNSGRAKNLIGSDYAIDDIPPLHRIFRWGDASIKDVETLREDNPKSDLMAKEMIFPCIQLCANGLVELCRPISFEEEDSCAMGNIMDMTFKEMVEKWNEKYLFTRREAKIIQQINNKLVNEKQSTQKDVKEVIACIETLRKECIAKAPYLSFSEICMLVFAIFQLNTGLSHPLDVNNFTMEECKNVIQNMDNWNKERAIENNDYSFGYPKGFFLNRIEKWLDNINKKLEKKNQELKNRR